MGRAMLWLVAGSASILVLASSLSGRPGLGLDNCIFWALIAIAAYRAFLLKMDLGAPWEGWRAAIRCISAGIVGLLAGLTVLVLAAGALVGAWNFSDRWTASSLALVIAACVTLSALQVDAQRRRLSRPPSSGMCRSREPTLTIIEQVAPLICEWPMAKSRGALTDH